MYEVEESESWILEEGEDLRERTKSFALRIIKMFTALPKEPVAQVLGKQILRSGTSVGANYREAFRSRSRAEFVAKCGESLKEIEETHYWLELLQESQTLPASKLSSLFDETNQLTAIFVTILKTTKSR